MKRKHKKRWSFLAWLCIVGVLLEQYPFISSKAGDYTTVAQAEFDDFSNWISGDYSVNTGAYYTQSSRVCYKEYLSSSGNVTYTITLSEKKYRILVRELDSGMKLVASNHLTDGDTFTTTENTAYLGVSLYNIANSKDTYDNYKNVFESGFHMDIESISQEEGLTGSKCNINLSKFSTWKSGDYAYTDGSYIANAARICQTDYIQAVEGTEYTAEISNKYYHLLVRELDENNKKISSYNLANGDSFIASENVAYFAISLYNYTGSAMTYESYQTLFEDGFTVALATSSEDEEELPEDPEVDTPSATSAYDFSDFSIWKSGDYSYNAGYYYENTARICLNDYIAVKGDRTFTICVDDKYVSILIRELDANKKFLVSQNLKNGETFTTNTQTRYLAVSMYSPSEKYTSYAAFEQLFASGCKVYFETDEEEEEDISTPSTGNEDETTEDDGSSDAKDAQFQAEFYQMLITADSEPHDISEYGYTFGEMNTLRQEVLDNEGFIAYNCYLNLYFTNTQTNKIVQTITMHNVDDDFAYRYEKVLGIIDTMKKETVGMSELEKVLYVHEYVDSHMYYYNDNYGFAFTGGGALAYGRAVCQGYSKSMRLLLLQLGIECENVAVSTVMNHMWNKVKIDGNWYQMDATWDDSRSRVSGEVDHYYFLRTDEEFLNDTRYKHHGWSGTIATDTTYTNWFVHDVKGQMYYYKGLWYYTDPDTGSIVRSDLMGNNYQEIVAYEGSGLYVRGIESGILTYVKAGKSNTVTIK